MVILKSHTGILLQNNVHDVPPSCVLCNNAIRHVFIECQALRAIRQRVLTRHAGYSVPTILSENIEVASVFKFLQILHMDTGI